MKWYTLEERPIKHGAWGLFCFANDMGFGSMSIGNRERRVRFFEKNDCHDPVEYYVDEIIYWIPLEELKLTLPKDLK